MPSGQVPFQPIADCVQHFGRDVCVLEMIVALEVAVGIVDQQVVHIRKHADGDVSVSGATEETDQRK